jgi:hypothetical protein
VQTQRLVSHADLLNLEAYAGTLAKSEYPSGDLSKELTLWIPGTSPACGKTNVLSM